MRCPKCRFISSDKRDLCPKCLLDLRDEKTRLGIEITRPNTSYDELVKAYKLRTSGKVKGKKLVKAEGLSKSAPHSPLSLWYKFTAVIRFGKPEKIKKPLAKEARIRKGQSVKAEAPPPGAEAAQPLQEKKRSLPKPREGAPIPLEEQTPPLAIQPEPNLAAPISAAPISKGPISKGPISIDEVAFDNLFEETPEEHALQIPDAEFMQLAEEMNSKIAEALSSTELLRELPKSSFTREGPQAAPAVFEFHEDDDAALEEQLDQLLGDEIVEVSAVKIPKISLSLQEDTQSLKVDDMEISFEFEVESSGEEMTAAEGASESAKQLLSNYDETLSSIGDTLDVDDDDDDDDDNFLGVDLTTLESRVIDRIPTSEEPPPLADLKGSIPGELRNSPERLAQYLLEYLAESLGCDPEDLFDVSPVITQSKEIAGLDVARPALELDTQLSALQSDGQSAASGQELSSDIPQSLATKLEDQEEEIGLSPLWSTVEREIALDEVDSIDIEMNQFFSTRPSEEILVLFDSAIAALEDRKIEQGYRSNIKVSEGRQLPTEQLEEIFEKYTDAAVEEYVKEKSSRGSEEPLTSIEQIPEEFTIGRSISFGGYLLETIKSGIISSLAALAYLWFMALPEASKEALLYNQLYWVILPYVSYTLGILALTFTATLHFGLNSARFDSSPLVR